MKLRMLKDLLLEIFSRRRLLAEPSKVGAGPSRNLVGNLCIVVLLSACHGTSVEKTREVESVPEGSQRADRVEPDTGRWHPSPKTGVPSGLGGKDPTVRLRALPYLQGTQPAPASSGVIRFQPEKVHAGLNLYNSGHGPEAFVTDLEGRVLHRWSYPIERIWPEERGPHQSSYWRRVQWLPDGDILAIFEGIGLIRLDKDSRLKWAYKGMVHHQAIVDADGTIVTLTRVPRVLPRYNPDDAILEDYLTRLSPDGQWLSELSLLEAFENSPFHRLLEGMKRSGDVFHTNSVELLDGRSAHRAAWLRRGNLLLSILFLDTICVLDLDQKKVVWALHGGRMPAFRGQHDARLLPSGRLLLFDNWGREGRSKVIEFDPLTLQVVWQYPRDASSDFYTATCGTSQRLANGNTLATESEKGRAFEITPEGEVVWEFFNPHRAGQQGELIATLFETRRVPSDYFTW